MSGTHIKTVRVCGIDWCRNIVDENDDGNTVIDPAMCFTHWTDFLLTTEYIRQKGGKHPSAVGWINHRNGLVKFLYVDAFLY